MARVSTTKCQRVVVGSPATVWATWARKSVSARVGPHEGATTSPVATSRVRMKAQVPWRTSSHSCRSTSPGRMGKPGCVRAKAWTPVRSSVLMTRSPRATSAGAARERAPPSATLASQSSSVVGGVSQERTRWGWRSPC